MKKVIVFSLILFILSPLLVYSQAGKSTDWINFDDQKTTTLEFTKSATLSIKNFSFQAVWNPKMVYSGNIGYYGGISELHIYKDKNLIQTIKNIEDGIALGYINITFYDYNMDGHLDFTIPIDCGKSCYDSFYLYNPQTNKFEYSKSWDYLRIDKFNKKKKQILSIPDGNAGDASHYLYQVKGNRLIKVKSIKS